MDHDGWTLPEERIRELVEDYEKRCSWDPRDVSPFQW